MRTEMQTELIYILILVAVLIASVQIGTQLVLKWSKKTARISKLEHVLDRIDSWWIILILLSLAFYFNKVGICILFGFISFLALREFVTLARSHTGDHRSLFWMFFIILPVQYFSVYNGTLLIFNYLIPMFAMIFLPFRTALVGDTDRFLERTASLQWGLMTSVFCVSHIPAILLIEIPGFNKNSELLLFFVLITQLTDVIQHETSLWFGKRKIAVSISSLKTWEGWFFSTTFCTLLGWTLSFMTPFKKPQAAIVALIITQLAFAGSLVMSAIKRSRGIQVFDELIPGHGGILDRIETIIFSAPVFFQIIQYLKK